MWDLKNVASVYSGKKGRCMCGCSGKYSYAATHRDYSSKDRGYPIDDDEVSDRSVKTIYNKILKLGPPNVLEDYILWADWGDRTYTIYFKREK